MKISRLFEIVYILLDKKIVTAEELAQKFEVSKRTIYRDIDTLCSSGIPIYTNKGKGGGISIVESFVLNKSLLSENEQNEILIGLQSLNVTNYISTDNILSKLSNLFNKNSNNWIEVDFSEWNYNAKEKNKFILLKNAVLNSNLVSFNYYNTNGEKTIRTVEPLQLLFKSNTWYLRAYCLYKDDYRVFKIYRIKDLEIKDEKFIKAFDEKFFTNCLNSNNSKNINVKIHISSFMAHRVYCEFKEENILKNDDGSFIINELFTEDEWFYGYILSFGNHARIIEPEHIKNRVKERLVLAFKNYS